MAKIIKIKAVKNVESPLLHRYQELNKKMIERAFAKRKNAFKKIS